MWGVGGRWEVKGGGKAGAEDCRHPSQIVSAYIQTYARTRTNTFVYTYTHTIKLKCHIDKCMGTLNIHYQ